jgi:murein DD-endopeptidase MepM/ murein hydrolase activator NlpD
MRFEKLLMSRCRFQLAVACQIVWALALVAPAWSSQSAPHKTGGQAWSAKWEPSKLVNGSPVIFRVTAPSELNELKGNFLGQELLFRSSATCHCWYAFAGVSLSTKPGTYTLRVEGKGPEMMSYAVTVAAASYPATTLKVAPEFVEPPKETLARIEADQATKKLIFSSVSTLAEPRWTGRFQPPAEAEVSGVFGSARVFNGVKKSQHTGLDFRVTTGTQVKATNSGTVILARPLYFEGNCVMIDHGQGLITLYLHLSEFKVKEGDAVEKGQIVGLSGGTGRATAPHLHFAVRWRGEYLDPRTLLELRPPEN